MVFGRALLPSLLALLLAASCGASSPPLNLDRELAATRERQIKDGPRAVLPVYERLLAAARSQKSERHEGLILGQMGTAYKNLGEYTRALQLHEQALAIKRALGDEIEVAKTLSNIGLVRWAQGDCQRALRLYAESLEIFTRNKAPRFAASVLNNQGLCHDALGDFRRSSKAYEQALAIHRDQGNEVGESEALGNLGGVALLLGRYAEAATYYEQSLAISTRLDAKQSMSLDLINLGSARLGTGDVAAGTSHLKRARTLAHDAGLLREEADATRGLAQWLELTGRYDEARKTLSEAANSYARAGLSNEQVDATHALGALDLDTGDLLGAAAAFERAGRAALELGYHTGRVAALLGTAQLELRRHNESAAAAAAERARDAASTAGDMSGRATAETWLARIRLRQGQPDAAVDAARSALIAANRSGGVFVVADARIALADALVASRRPHEALAEYDAALQTADVTAVPDLLWRANFGRGHTLEARGRLDDALASYLRAVTVIEQVRGQLVSDRTRAGFLEDKREVYAALVRVLLRLGRPKNAFQAAERLRAQAYRELIARSALLGRSDMAESAVLLARIRHLQASIEGELRQTRDGERGLAVAQYSEELRAAEDAWAKTLAVVPTGRALGGDEQPSADSIQRRLPAGSALIEYVVDRDETVVFVLTTTAIRARVLNLKVSDLRTRIELLRGLLARRESTGWETVAERLDADLIAPLRDAGWLRGASRLYIVPHAELNYLPFAVLRHVAPCGDGGLAPECAGARVLVDDVAPVMLPAAAALAQPRPRRPASTGLLAFAPDRTRLPFARHEVESLVPLFAPSQLAIGREATEARFKREAGRYRVLHLATHGFFNRVSPLFSGIELEPTPDEDGRLEVFEILGLRLASDLVTLSACDTALGSGELSDLPAGEELVGLTRAFLSAGSRSVLATLWEIADRTTADLMTEVYSAARARPFPEALALVQRRRAHGEGRDAHPWYWAAFLVAEGREASPETARLGP